jgi:flavin reductase (DIM6/NTAB) family NADH-FMN oxidoreductase RutF
MFARHATPARTDRFARLDWAHGRHGAPLLTDALASFECEIVAEHPAGDHWIVVGRVTDVLVAPVEEPLVFFAGAFGTARPRRRPRGVAASGASTPRRA